jgi:acyl-CoA thioester hydrolase
MEPVFSYEFDIPAETVDENGHVNNVMYVQWMQDAAVRHYEAMGGTGPTQAIGATWVVRSHSIEYLKPALPGSASACRPG